MTTKIRTLITLTAILAALLLTGGARADTVCWTNPQPNLPSSGVELSVETININTASLDDLERLYRVGAVTAVKIEAGRPYDAPEDIMRVKGIGPKTYAANRLWIATEGETTLSQIDNLPAWDAEIDGDALAWERIECSDEIIARDPGYEN